MVIFALRVGAGGRAGVPTRVFEFKLLKINGVRGTSDGNPTAGLLSRLF